MVFLGGTPAGLIGVATIGVGWLRWRDTRIALLNNLVAYAWFPLVGGLVFTEVSPGWLNLGERDGFFYLLTFVVFVLALALNFLIIALQIRYEEGTAILELVRKLVVPVMSSEVFAALLAVGVTYLYIARRARGDRPLRRGPVHLPAPARPAAAVGAARGGAREDAATSSPTARKQLATLQVGVLSALLRTLDLRDRMTARHSAAVARYAREIAIAAGFSKEEQDLVHTAGLLHDIGKFIFPDRILKGDTQAQRRGLEHHQDAPVSGGAGGGPDGGLRADQRDHPGSPRADRRQGLPAGLARPDIPALSRIISVADTYDVMTARDSYRKPISSFEAIQELKRVVRRTARRGVRRDVHQILAGKDVRFRHGEDADFDAELGLDKRVEEYSLPPSTRSRSTARPPRSRPSRPSATQPRLHRRVGRSRRRRAPAAARSGGTMFTY